MEANGICYMSLYQSRLQRTIEKLDKNLPNPNLLKESHHIHDDWYKQVIGRLKFFSSLFHYAIDFSPSEATHFYQVCSNNYRPFRLASSSTQLFASQESWSLLTSWQVHEDAESQVLPLSLHEVEFFNAVLRWTLPASTYLSTFLKVGLDLLNCVHFPEAI